MINDLKDLQALFKLCRKQGITDFKMNGVEIKFGELPSAKSIAQQEELEPEVTDEDLLYYSSEAGQAFLDKKVGLS